MPAQIPEEYLFIFLAVVALIAVLALYRVAKRGLGAVVNPFVEEGFEVGQQKQAPPQAKVAIACLMRKPVDLPLWFRHHTNLGVSLFFIRLEDTPGLDDYLALRRDVIYEVSQSDKSGDNYKTLQDRQIAYVNKCLEKAAEMGVDWLFHIDADELLHGSLTALDGLDPSVKTIKIENAEAVFEDGAETCFSANKFLRCAQGAQCRSYVNGKAAGKVERGVKIAGPHDFSYNGEIEGSFKKILLFESLHVLHFDACSLGAWVEKYKHLGANAKSDIPFPYYKESIGAAQNAFDIYKKHVMRKPGLFELGKVYNA
jgi:hypothetical protein